MKAADIWQRGVARDLAQNVAGALKDKVGANNAQSGAATTEAPAAEN